MLGERHELGLVVVLGPDVHGLPQVAAGERDDLAGHRRREQHGLPARRRQLQDALDVGEETEVKHLVGFVEDQRCHVRQVEMVLARQVEEPAWGADHHVHGAAQGLDLGFVGTTAVQREHPRAARPRRGLEIPRDLDREFPGRHHDQGARRQRPPVRGSAEALQQRDAEGKRFACSGPCLADDVVPGERNREGQRLDGKRGGDSMGRQRVADRAAHTEVGEGRVGRCGRDADGLVGVPGGLYLCCQGFQLPSMGPRCCACIAHAITIPGPGIQVRRGPVRRQLVVVAFSTLGTRPRCHVKHVAMLAAFPVAAG